MNRFSWRPDSYSEQESAWSLVQKFGYLNSFSSRDILKVAEQGLDHSKTSGVSAINLVKPTASSQAIIRIIQEQHGADAPIDNPWLWPSSLTLYNEQPIANYLRYCVECANRGFHSSLFQLLCSRRCPIHSKALVDVCTSCGSRIPYSISAATLSNPYGCRCGSVFWSRRDDRSWKAFSPRSTDVFEEWLKWRNDILANQKPGFLSAMWHKGEVLRANSYQYLPESLAIATNAPRIVRRLLSAGRKASNSTSVTSFFARNANQPLSDQVLIDVVNSAFQDQFEYINFECDAFLRDQHSFCRNSLKKNLGWAPIGQQVPSCEAVISVERWRQYWHTRVSIGELNGPLFESVAREVTSALSLIGVERRYVEKTEIRHLTLKLAEAFFKCTLSAAYRITMQEIATDLNVANRAWPGLDYSMWPCWSIQLGEGDGFTRLFIFWPEVGPSLLNVQSSRRHRAAVRERVAYAAREICDRLPIYRMGKLRQ